MLLLLLIEVLQLLTGVHSSYIANVNVLNVSGKTVEKGFLASYFTAAAIHSVVLLRNDWRKDRKVLLPRSLCLS